MGCDLLGTHIVSVCLSVYLSVCLPAVSLPVCATCVCSLVVSKIADLEGEGGVEAVARAIWGADSIWGHLEVRGRWGRDTGSRCTKWQWCLFCKHTPI
jgi:uncharacterized protein YceK